MVYYSPKHLGQRDDAFTRGYNLIIVSLLAAKLVSMLHIKPIYLSLKDQLKGTVWKLSIGQIKRRQYHLVLYEQMKHYTCSLALQSFFCFHTLATIYIHFPSSRFSTIYTKLDKIASFCRAFRSYPRYLCPLVPLSVLLLCEKF